MCLCVNTGAVHLLLHWYDHLTVHYTVSVYNVIHRLQSVLYRAVHRGERGYIKYCRDKARERERGSEGEGERELSELVD